MGSRPDLTDLGLSMGKKGRLRRILHQSGLRNGTALLLPYGADLSRAPQRSVTGQAGDPTDAIRLAFEGNFNGIVLPVELAEKFYGDYAGELPLIVMLNGHSDGPGSAAADGTVADAVRLGADAVGYLLYADGPARDTGFPQYQRVQEDAERYGMPLFVWVYPRGTAGEAMGGSASPPDIADAASTARTLGADVAVVSFPHPERPAGAPHDEYAAISPEHAIDTVVRSAGRTLVLVSSDAGGSDEAMLEEARQAMAAGATGLIFDRDITQRGHSELLPLITQLNQILATYCN
jgi:fructose-bisphosphate aldolase, class I